MMGSPRLVSVPLVKVTTFNIRADFFFEKRYEKLLESVAVYMFQYRFYHLLNFSKTLFEVPN